MAEWREISVRVAKAEVEKVEQVFERHAAVAITISSGEHTQEIFDLLDQQYRLWRFVEVTALFPIAVLSDPVLASLTSLDVEVQAPEIREFADQDWVMCWQRSLQPLNFGHGLFICPPDVVPPKEAEKIILLTPGMAFGTGTHPTTAMCLRWLAARQWDDNVRLLDFGCGSGVLAIAAAKCGAAEIYACDIDPQALEVANANAELNLVNNISICSNEDLPSQQVDVVLANILLEPLIAEKSTITQRLKVGGKLVLSGILAAQSERLIGAFAPEFKLEVTCTEDNWALVSGNKISPAI